jgi:hypothetical protein
LSCAAQNKGFPFLLRTPNPQIIDGISFNHGFVIKQRYKYGYFVIKQRQNRRKIVIKQT